jgi:CotH kinase protein
LSNDVRIFYTLDCSIPSTVGFGLSPNPTLEARNTEWITTKTMVIRYFVLFPGKDPVTATPLIATDIRTCSLLSTRSVVGQTVAAGVTPKDTQAKPAGYEDVTENYHADGTPAAFSFKLAYAMDPVVLKDVQSTVTNQLWHTPQPGDDPAKPWAPTLSVVIPTDQLFQMTTKGIYAASHWKENVPLGDPLGRDWVRTASVSFMDPTTGVNTSWNCGFQMSGTVSLAPTATLKHSMKMKFKSSYSILPGLPVNGKLNWNFPQSLLSPNVHPVTGNPLQNSFDSLTIRNTGQNSWPWESTTSAPYATYSNEAFARLAQRAAGATAPRGRWIHLYLNGLYWGMYDLCEEVDTTMIAASEAAAPSTQYDIMKEGSYAEEGTDTEWVRVQQLALDKFNANPLNVMSFLENEVDIDNYIDYLIINTRLAPSDWPHNNWRAYREKTAGARWRFIVWDTQAATLDGASNTPASLDLTGRFGYVWSFNNAGTFHYRMEFDPDYRRRFADRVHKMFYYGGVLSIGKPAASTLTADSGWTLGKSALDAFWNGVESESARWGWLGLEKNGAVQVAWRHRPVKNEVVSYFGRTQWTARYGTASAGIRQAMSSAAWLETYYLRFFRNEHPTALTPTPAPFPTLPRFYPLVRPPVPSNWGSVGQNGAITFSAPIVPPVTTGNSIDGGFPETGTIYYTTSGADPRTLVVGDPALISGSTPLIVTSALTVKARTKSAAGVWSAMTEFKTQP